MYDLVTDGDYASSVHRLTDRYQNFDDILNDPYAEQLAFAMDMSKADFVNLQIKTFCTVKGVLEQPVVVRINGQDKPVTNVQTGEPLMYGDVIGDRSGPKFSGSLTDKRGTELFRDEVGTSTRKAVVRDQIAATKQYCQQKDLPPPSDEVLQDAASVAMRTHSAQRKLSDFDLTVFDLDLLTSCVATAVEEEMPELEGEGMPKDLRRQVGEVAWKQGGEIDTRLIRQSVRDGEDYAQLMQRTQPPPGDPKYYHMLSESAGQAMFSQSINMSNLQNRDSAVDVDSTYGLGFPVMGPEVVEIDGKLKLTTEVYKEYKAEKISHEQALEILGEETLEHKGLVELGDVIADSQSSYTAHESKNKNAVKHIDELRAVVGEDRFVVIADKAKGREGLGAERLFEVMIKEAQLSELSHQGAAKELSKISKIPLADIFSNKVPGASPKQKLDNFTKFLNGDLEIKEMPRPELNAKQLAAVAEVSQSRGRLEQLNAVKRSYEGGRKSVSMTEISEETAKKMSQMFVFSADGKDKKIYGNISDTEKVLFSTNRAAREGDPEAIIQQQVISFSCLLNFPRWGVNADNLGTVGGEVESVTAQGFKDSIQGRSYSFGEESSAMRDALGWGDMPMSVAKERLKNYKDGAAEILAPVKENKTFFKLTDRLKQAYLSGDADRAKEMEGLIKMHLDNTLSVEYPQLFEKLVEQAGGDRNKVLDGFAQDVVNSVKFNIKREELKDKSKGQETVKSVAHAVEEIEAKTPKPKRKAVSSKLDKVASQQSEMGKAAAKAKAATKKTAADIDKNKPTPTVEQTQRGR